MPGVAVHLICAQRVLQRWNSERSAPPFRLDDPELVEAFFQGAIAPDMGYYRRGAGRISDLAHRVRSADLARSILQHARSPLQIAYAWGWTTHILADVAVHPLINRAASELMCASDCGPVSAADGLASHLRVELGLDAHFQWRSTCFRPARFKPVLSASRLRFLTTSFRETHGVEVRAGEIARAQLAMLRLAPWLLTLNGVIGPAHAALRSTRAGRSFLADPPPQRGEGGLAVALGFCRPVAPQPWLVRRVVQVLKEFADSFFEQYRTGLNQLPNLDLDTGALAGATVAPSALRPAAA